VTSAYHLTLNICLKLRRKGRDLSEAEVKALVKVCKADKTPAGARDAAMLGIWYTCGIRRSELVRLDLADFDRINGKLTIRGSQSRKARTVYIPKGARPARMVSPFTTLNAVALV
jgi:integrase/recombinase XerD